MGIKGVIQANRVMDSKYRAVIQPGVGDVLFTSIDGLGEELDTSELPDRTAVSGGRSKPGELECIQPIHQRPDYPLMLAWYNACKATIPGYKKLGTITLLTDAGPPSVMHTVRGMFISAWKQAILELEGEGKMVVVTWTIKFDNLISTPL
jgi:hypothetical protein